MDKLYLIGDGEMLFICYPKMLNLPESGKKWLDAQKIEYTERNIVDVNPTCGELKEWYSKSGFPLEKSSLIPAAFFIKK